MTTPSESVMSIQAIEQNIRLYIELEKTRIRLHQEKVKVQNRQAAVGKALTDRVPDEFFFLHDGQIYRFSMGTEDWGVKEVEKIEDFEVWKTDRKEPEDLTGEEREEAVGW